MKRFAWWVVSVFVGTAVSHLASMLVQRAVGGDDDEQHGDDPKEAQPRPNTAPARAAVVVPIGDLGGQWVMDQPDGPPVGLAFRCPSCPVPHYHYVRWAGAGADWRRVDDGGALSLSPRVVGMGGCDFDGEIRRGSVYWTP